MPSLDLRSLSIMTGMIDMALGVILLAFRHAYPRSIKGLLPWAMAPVASALATLVFAMDGRWPALSVVLGGNGLMLAGAGLYYVGSQRFFGVPVTWPRWLAVGLVCLAGLGWYQAVSPDYRIRVVLLACTVAAVCLAHARLMWRHGKGFGPRFTAAILLLQVLILLLRAVTTLFLDAPDSARFVGDVIQTTYIGAFCFSTLFICIGLLLTVSEHMREQFEQLSQRDDLTGVLNRRAVLLAGDRELQQWRNGGRAFSLLIMDIDHFKRINDQYGHLVGDRVLVHFVETVRQALRHTDQLGRFGGEEFVVLMPQTDRPAALATAERVRQAVANQASEDWPTCTASVGLASVEAGETTLDGVLSRADAALYRAKAGGRDRVAVG